MRSFKTGAPDGYLFSFFPPYNERYEPLQYQTWWLFHLADIFINGVFPQQIILNEDYLPDWQLQPLLPGNLQLLSL